MQRSRSRCSKRQQTAAFLTRAAAQHGTCCLFFFSYTLPHLLLQSYSQDNRPKKESILDLTKIIDKKVTVKFNGGREGIFLFF